MNKKFIFLILLVFIFTFWIFWLPGVRVANDYHLPQNTSLSEQIFPWIFRETNVADGLGEYTGVTLWSQPMHLVFGSLSKLPFPPGFVTKIEVFLIFVLGFFSLSKLLDYFKIQKPFSYLGTLFYNLNAFILFLIDGGQVSLALSYAIFPLAFFFFLIQLEKPNLKNRLNLIATLLAISIFDIRIIYLLFIICSLYLIFNFFLISKKEIMPTLKEAFFSAFLIILTLAAFHTYWILPSILIKSPQLPQTYDRTSQIDFLSFSSVGHSLLLQQPHWYKNVFGQVSNLKAEFIFIPVLIFLVPLLHKKDKVVGFWLIIAALGIFLSKGSQPPLGQIYPWLFTHIPLFSIFRDPTKFYLFISLSYSILVAISLQELVRLGKNKLILYFVLIYLVLLVRPIYLGEMTGLFSVPVFQKEYNQIANILTEDKGFSRVFWIPNSQPLSYVSSAHPQVEASRLAAKRPFAVGTKGAYETLNFLREAPYMGEIFDVAGIGYIVYPYLNPRRADMHPDNIRYFNTFTDQLNKRDWLTKVNTSALPVYKVNEHQDRFFITPNIWFILGSDNIYNEATMSAQLKLSKNALIFVDEQSGFGEKINEIPQAKIVLNNKTQTDLAASFINLANIIFPAESLSFKPDQSGWWKKEAIDLINFRDFLQTKYGIDNQDFDLGGGWAIGEGDLKLKVKSKKLKKGDLLLTRVLESSRSGELNFNQDGQFVGKVLTKKEGNNVKWFEVGQLPKDEKEIEITAAGDINIINALAVLTKDEWNNYQNKVRGLAGRVVSFNKNNATESARPIITYQEINPTKYKVTVSNLVKPAFVVFSENYDNLWKLNGQTPLPVYSLLNGYRVEKDGEYTIEYEAQKYVNNGLVITLFTLIALSLCVFKAKKI